MKVLASASITVYLNAFGLVGHFGCSGFGITATYKALSAPLFSLLKNKAPGNPHGLPGVLFALTSLSTNAKLQLI